MYIGDSSELLSRSSFKGLRGKVQLIFTSPPFSLIKKKSYGNHRGQAYINWLASYADLFRDLLAPDGSLVIELGNSWERGTPTMSTVPLEALMALKSRGEFHLCQEVIWNNPARLPSPAQWVNVERIRLKDSFTRIWWMSPSANPKADNRRILSPYSERMRDLLETQKYNAGRRPGGAVVGASSFLTNHGGAIPSSVIPASPQLVAEEEPAANLLHISNTINRDAYREHCRTRGLKVHDARMPVALADFFIRFLTDERDLVLDPFAGSNTTGRAAESLRRRWRAIEQNAEFANASISLFPNAKNG